MSGVEQSNTLPEQPQTPSFAMLRTLGGIAMLSGFLVVLVYQWTKPMIAENQRIAIEQAVSTVVNNVASKRDFIVTGEGVFPAGAENVGTGEKVYAGYNAKGELQGIALAAAATGYQDVIRILYGYSPWCSCVTGIKVLKMTETPGLGDKIAFDPEFLKNFESLDAMLNAEQNGLANPIHAVKHGNKTHPWQIDSISGATISSKAIGRMINQSGQRMFPLIKRHLAVFQAPPPAAQSAETTTGKEG